MDRKKLYDRIDKRVDSMIKNGLVDEVRTLTKFRLYNALNTIGYKEIFSYLDGSVTLEHAISEIKKYQKICQTTNNLVKIKKKYYLGK